MRRTGPVVLVTDGEQRATLAVTRSLGRAGYRVVVAASRRGAIAAASRHAWRTLIVPSAGDGDAAFAGAIEATVRRSGAAIVLPMTEPAILALLPMAGRCGPARIATPPADAFERIRNKELLLQRAAASGIVTPRQVSVARPDRLDALASVSFPAVLKPARSVFAAGGSLEKISVDYATSAADLQRQLRAIPLEAYPVLVQEYVQGPGIGIFVLVDEAGVIARFAHRRVREKPPSGGVSVCSESIPFPGDLGDASLRLLRDFGWRGVAMVEFKLDEASGRHCLMEVNGRFWGSLQLAIEAGVDFPRLLIEQLTGARPDPVLTYQTGIRNRWEWGEIDAALIRARRPHPVTGERTRLATVLGDLVRVRPGIDHAEVFRFSDPAPFLRETLAWLRRA